jgi:hypothetical protein
VTLDGVQRSLRSACYCRFRRALSFSVDSSGLGESWLFLHTYLPFSNGFGFEQDVEQPAGQYSGISKSDQRDAIEVYVCLCVCVATSAILPLSPPHQICQQLLPTSHFTHQSPSSRLFKMAEVNAEPSWQAIVGKAACLLAGLSRTTSCLRTRLPTSPRFARRAVGSTSKKSLSPSWTLRT